MDINFIIKVFFAGVLFGMFFVCMYLFFEKHLNNKIKVIGMTILTTLFFCPVAFIVPFIFLFKGSSIFDNIKKEP